MYTEMEKTEIVAEQQPSRLDDGSAKNAEEARVKVF